MTTIDVYPHGTYVQGQYLTSREVELPEGVTSAVLRTTVDSVSGRKAKVTSMVRDRTTTTAYDWRTQGIHELLAPGVSVVTADGDAFRPLQRFLDVTVSVTGTAVLQAQLEY